jgi:F420-dependent oxidoreductase-like protein
VRICLMIEGQEGVSWEQWLALAEACERNGLEGLFRSDHYTTVMDREVRGSLDAWSTIAALGAVTDRIRLGTMVSPVTFRHPSVLAKSVVTADHVSGGRVELGLGAGWLELEHTTYGFPFPDAPTRMDLLEEQAEIIVRQWTEEDFDHDGEHYRLRDCRALPRPLQQPRPPLIVGGYAGERSVAVAARWADEYNTPFASVEECRTRRTTVESAWERAGRDPGELRFSLMTGLIIGTDRGEVRHRADRVAARTGRDAEGEEMLARQADVLVAGTPDEAVSRLRALADAGVDRVMLQHLLHEDLEVIDLLGREVLPQVAR